GLFCIGEMTDVDGRCGGYNLQWAWTSGAIAGEAAATYVLSEAAAYRGRGSFTSESVFQTMVKGSRRA
ncbi:MAG: NAD(P)/FAD-dependent oxidoreductase, partial [Butyrivibrio sp.]|nr:NAD(P)/FAD-dependent oxidoreductase [Butyrivibrio sp.]